MSELLCKLFLELSEIVPAGTKTKNEITLEAQLTAANEQLTAKQERISKLEHDWGHETETRKHLQVLRGEDKAQYKTWLNAVSDRETAANARADVAEATAEKLLQMERDRFANFEAAFGTLPKPMAQAAQPTPADREKPEHVCGLVGFGQDPHVSDTCKRCELDKADREDCDG